LPVKFPDERKQLMFGFTKSPTSGANLTKSRGTVTVGWGNSLMGSHGGLPLA
jgi:hypothetical protein